MTDAIHLYTLGLVLNSRETRILLVHKAPPRWAAGTWNAPGGRLAADEIPYDGITRKVAHETGLEIRQSNWLSLAYLSGRDYYVHIYHTRVSDDQLDRVRTPEGREPVGVWDLDRLPPLTAGLAWMIHLALDPHTTARVTRS